jgi:hypothetical protein
MGDEHVMAEEQAREEGRYSHPAKRGRPPAERTES